MVTVLKNTSAVNPENENLTPLEAATTEREGAHGAPDTTRHHYPTQPLTTAISPKVSGLCRVVSGVGCNSQSPSAGMLAAAAAKATVYGNPDKKPVIAAPQLDKIDAALQAEPRWVLWRLEWRGRDWSKIPYQGNGRCAKSNDPATWARLDDLLPPFYAGDYDGIGFMLGGGFVGVDLDKVTDPASGEIDPAVSPLIEMAATFTDLSPSDTGFKLIGRGEWRGDWHKLPFGECGEIEVYGSGRFFTVTGRGHGEVVDIQATLDALAAHRKSKPAPTKTVVSVPRPHHWRSDADLIAKINSCGNHGVKFERLMSGDTSDYGGDASRADFALCCILVWWTNHDLAIVDRVFRESGLFRPKWNERRKESTYGNITIEKADAKVQGGYDGAHSVTPPDNIAELSGAEPVAITVAEYQPFPVDALPPVLREFVDEVSASVGADPAFAALPTLSVIGAAIGASIAVSPKRGFREFPALWCCTVGDSGTGKSPCMRPATEAAFAVNRELQEKHAAAMEKYAADLAAWEGQGVDDPKGKPKKPAREYFAVIDCTIERLAEMVASSPRGLVMVRDELDGWFGSFTKYKGAAGGSDVPNWLSMFDAGAISYHRRSGEPRDVEVDRAFVAVCGGIQFGVLRSALSNEAYIASGLAARLLFAMPPKHCPKWSDAELSQQTEQRFREVVAKLRGLPFNATGSAYTIGVDAAALDRFKALNNEFAARAEDTNGGPMAAVLPKAVRFALRLALVWHCVNEVAAGRDPGRGCLRDDAMQAGETLARWFVNEASRLYAAVAETPENSDARRLVEWVNRKGGRVRARDLQRSNPQKYRLAKSAEAALESLVTAKLGTWEEHPPTEKGGRPTQVFILTP